MGKDIEIWQDRGRFRPGVLEHIRRPELVIPPEYNDLCKQWEIAFTCFCAEYGVDVDKILESDSKISIIADDYGKKNGKVKIPPRLRAMVQGIFGVGSFVDHASFSKRNEYFLGDFSVNINDSRLPKARRVEKGEYRRVIHKLPDGTKIAVSTGISFNFKKGTYRLGISSPDSPRRFSGIITWKEHEEIFPSAPIPLDVFTEFPNSLAFIRNHRPPRIVVDKFL